MDDVWNLDGVFHDSEKVYSFMKEKGYDKNTHEKYKVGETIYFNTGLNDDIRAQAVIKGINGKDIYVYNDCYWFPIQDNDITKISRERSNHVS